MSEPRNRAERRAHLRKARRAAGAALTASGAALSSGALILGTAGPAGAVPMTFTVNDAGDAGDNTCDVSCTLRDAIDDANNNVGADTIVFDTAGTFATPQTITLASGQLEISDSVTIAGPGAANVTVSGNNATRVFYVYNGAADITVTISGITVTEGDDGDGAGIILWGENLTLTNTVVTGNDASDQGGGLAMYNSAGDYANLVVNGSSVFYDNYAEDRGGAIFVSDGTIHVQSGVRIANNEAGTEGGGIAIEDTDEASTITGATITGNTADDSGGGIYLYDPDDPVTISNTTITDNDAGYNGGGVGLYDTDSAGEIVITGSTISGNEALYEGGGLYFYGPDNNVTISNTTISGNSAGGGESGGDGGGIYFYDLDGDYTLLIESSTISDNHADDDGGGIYLYETSGTVEIVNTTISGNTADDDGGGIYWYDTDDPNPRIIRNTTISGNTATNRGGGIVIEAVEDNILVANSTISGNTAGEGGAAALEAGEESGLDFFQTTITDNHVNGGTTGGLYLGDLEVAGASEAEHAQKHALKVAAHKKHRADDVDVQANVGGPTPTKDPKDPEVKDAGVDDVGAAVAGGHELLLAGTIVSGNDGLDIGGDGGLYADDSIESDHSLIGSVITGAALTDLGGTIFSTDPGLAPLADNGGPTLTHALLTGSLALDAGPVPVPAFPGNEFDQRGAGFPRVVNGVVDIGAYEALLLVLFTG